MDAGWIYVLVSPSLPGVVKIGRTTRDPLTRAGELGGYAGATARYYVVAHAAVSDPVKCETHAHRMLKPHRRKGTELFEVTPERASHVLFAVAAAANRPERRFSRRYRRQRARAPRAIFSPETVAMLLVSGLLLLWAYFG